MAEETILDLSNQKLKKFNKPNTPQTQILTLILDDNELQRLDNVDVFINLQKLSTVRNQLLRMYGVCRLHTLQELNLSHNGILTIEGLKDLNNLKWLCLAGNNIKTIEHLNTNVNLEYLDLSENNITHISDISFLKNLKELFLHNNKINHLRQCERFLPHSLVTLTLANNNIEDLNEISQLVNLINLNSISIANNPCVNMSNNAVGFDYRPFVINWCLNIKTIDGYVVDPIESLRAEWLYSQGRGRHFHVGDQKELVQYLSGVCPLTGDTLETEEDRKLRLILSKAQHHQQQLREQSNCEMQTPSPSTRKKRISPRMQKFKKSPDRMSTSCYNNMSNFNDDANIMTQSLDPTILRQTTDVNGLNNDNQNQAVNSPLPTISKMVPVPELLMSPDYRPSPLITNKILNSNKNKSVKNQSSPMSTVRNTINNKTKPNATTTEIRKINTPSPVRQKKISSINNSSNSNSNKQLPKSPKPILRKSPSTDDESEICVSKLKTIQRKAEQKKQEKDAEILSNSSSVDDKVEQAAVCIQKVWRGYFTRNRNKEIQEMFKTLQAQRAHQYIQQLTNDMETTKAALESERKIQMLQTEAISALWKQLSALQPNSSTNSNLNMTNLTLENSEIVRELAQTCSILQNQIQQLQTSMQDIVKVMSVFSQSQHHNQQQNKDIGIATQTDIVAVHTPQGDAGKVFPFHKQNQSRPSSLPLPIHQRKKDSSQLQQNNTELKQFAGSLVEGAIKCVSGETSSDFIENDDDVENEDAFKNVD